jgi:hypothetical protein
MKKLLATTLFTSLLSCPAAYAATLKTGNLIVSVNEFTGSVTAPTYVAEYSTLGVREQILFDVPIPGSFNGPTTQQARDLVLDNSGTLHLYNGTFDPYLLSFDLESETFVQRTFDGWSTVNNGTYGGIAVLGNNLFLTDMRTFGDGDLPQGILEVNTNTFSFNRFASNIEPEDLNIGLDGTLYAINGNADPTSNIFLIDPISFEQIGIVSVDREDHRAVAGAADGTFFTAAWDGVIRHYNRDGDLLNSLAVPGARFSDIDISVDGKLALGTAFDGEVFITDTTLTAFDRFRVTDSSFGGDVFVSWVAGSDPESVPEPSAILGVVIAGGVSYAARRRRNRQFKNAE